MTVGMDVPSAQDYELQIFEEKAAESLVPPSTNRKGEKESLTFPVKAKTTYYVKVYPADHSYFSKLDPYTLNIGPRPLQMEERSGSRGIRGFRGYMEWG